MKMGVTYMIRHIALFRWSATASDEIKAQVTAGMAELRDEIPSVRNFAFGEDLGLDSRNWDVGLVADVDDHLALEEYFKHPVMSRVSALIRTATQPDVTARIQFELQRERSSHE